MVRYLHHRLGLERHLVVAVTTNAVVRPVVASLAPISCRTRRLVLVAVGIFRDELRSHRFDFGIPGLQGLASRTPQLFIVLLHIQ